uniref:Rho GTPase activating protein 23a n=1 Tax=Neogobius melanostomus TaxID=47308 RepID=A0A8C6UST1_9GOBI
MDTIFVKNVREKGPAHQAGLCTGDRLVKVNGESVLGKTYSQVIALIQNSESVLELSIMPKDEDVLQLAYSHDAYLTGNEPYSGGADHLPPPPPICYPRTKSQPPAGTPSPGSMGQNQLDNWTRWPGSSGPSSPLDNRSAVGSPASWQEGRPGDPGGVGHSSPAHRTEEIQYGMTSQQPQGQTRGRSYSSSSSSGPLSSPLQVHYPNHTSSQASPRKSSSAWTSPPMPQPHVRTERAQQALSDWYYSQRPERPGRSTQSRQRSYSQDRLSEYKRQQQRSGGWPHSASQDTLFLLQQSGPGPQGEPYWSYGDYETGPGRGHTSSNYTRTRSENLLAQYDHHGRSMEMLDRTTVSPRFERPAWNQQPPQPPPRNSRQAGQYVPPQPSVSRHSQPHPKHPSAPHPQAPQQQAVPQSRRLPHGQSMDDQPVGYRSYSPSFYRKTGRIMQAHSFRDPSYSGPHLNWNPTSPPEVAPAAPLVSSTSSPLSSSASESQDRSYRPTNHERERGAGEEAAVAQAQEVNMRQAHYPLPIDGLEPSLFSPDQDPGEGAPRKPNGSLAPLPIEDDSLASIPFIGDIKSTRRSSYLLAITTERSKSCDEGLNSFRDEGRVFSRLPKRVKSFFTDGSLDNLGSAEEVRSKRHSTSELGNITYSDVRREGWLHYKQILTEKGKVKSRSSMRPWKRVFSVMRSHSLFLYKDKREAVLRGATIGGGAEDDQPISIRGCLVDIAYSETKRKNALRLTTQDFCEYLLQAEDREDMLDWIAVIREGNKTDNEELGFSRQALISKKLNDYRKQSSPPKSPWGINIIKKSKKAGPKAFGVRLEECQPGANNKFIPMIVEICCGLVEEMGLEYTGIYRVPGNNAMVSQLQDQLNKGVDINPTEEKWQDLNVVSSLLKSFFRKLPEPLFTNDKYNDFIDANRMESPSDRLKTMKKMIRDLPDHYYHTLKFLVMHLKTVADNSDKNKMEPRNLALVFGPTLVRTSDDNMKDMVTHMPDRYKIVETLILHGLWFFNEENDKDEKTPVDTEDVQPAPNIDHLLSNIGRTALLGEASDSTNSDSAKSKGSWGSKRDLTTSLTLSIMSAVTGRNKRRKRHNGRRVGSSTDDDSEHEPNRAGHSGTEEGEEEDGESPTADVAPRAEEEADDDDEEEEEEVADKAGTEKEAELVKEEVEGDRHEEADARVKETHWRSIDDARSIVSGYSTLSTLGRSLGSEGRGDDADDEHSELVSETDNESGFASRSLTQERPEKKQNDQTSAQTPAAPRSFLYTQHKQPVPTPTSLLAPPTPDTGERSDGGARSTTPSSSSFSSSSTAHKLHTRPSFNSHKLIQCDTLARKKLKGEKVKAKSLDVLELVTAQSDSSEGRARRDTSRTNPSSASSQESLRLSRPKPAVASLAEQVRARLMGSADDLRIVGMRKPLSPDTRRKRRAWRRHTVVASPTENSDKRPPIVVNNFPLSPRTFIFHQVTRERGPELTFL